MNRSFIHTHVPANGPPATHNALNQANANSGTCAAIPAANVDIDNVKTPAGARGSLG